MMLDTKSTDKKEGKCNKTQLIEEFAAKSNLSKKEAAKLVQIWIDILFDGITEGKKIVISDFGVFHLSTRKAFKGYDPMNECTITVPKRYVPVFKVGKSLKEKLNNLES